MPIDLPWGKIIAFVVIVGAIVGGIWGYGEHRYNQGKADADTTWTKSYNAKVEEDNKKIAGLEADSKEAKDKLQAQATELAAKLDGVMQEVTSLKRRIPDPNAKPSAPGAVVKLIDVNLVDLLHASDGSSMSTGQCKDSILYLGNDFTKYWNEQNDATNRQLQ